MKNDLAAGVEKSDKRTGGRSRVTGKREYAG